MKIYVEWREGQKELDYQKDISVENMLKDIDSIRYPIYSCLINNEPKRLDTILTGDCKV